MHDSRGAFEWGLASVLVGGAALCGGMVSYSGPPYLEQIPFVENVPGIIKVVLVIPVVLQAIAVAGTAFGGRSVVLSRRSRRPMALGLAGILLGGAALFNWAIVGLSWYSWLDGLATYTPFGPTPSFGTF